MQKFKFPMQYLRVTQGENSTYSHAGSLAMDFGGKDTGSDKLYCPCDMIVKRCRQNATGECYLESIEPVLFADGTSDYARLLCIHDSTFNVHEGQIVKQGEYFYDEGGMGSGNPNKFATHVHIEAGKGKWKSCTQFANSQGVYVCENQAHLYDLFLLGDDVIIKDAGGYSWKRASNVEKEESEMKNIYGVDLSHNRSLTAMEKIKANGKAEFVVHRVAIGSDSVDKNLDQYLKDMGDLKVGFFSANYFCDNNDAVKEAEYLINEIEKRGFNPDNVDLPIFEDWEGFSYSYNAKNGRIITPEQLREMTVAWCEYVKSCGYVAGIYTNKDYWDNWFGQEFFDAHPDYKIWFARPIDAEKPDRECYMWQYAANDGAEYGLAGEPLDKNILYGEYVTDMVKPLSETPCQACIGPASQGDVKTVKTEVEKLGVEAKVDGDYVITGEMTKGDQLTIVKLCKSLFIPCVKYESAEESCESCEKLAAELIAVSEELEIVRMDYSNMLNKAQEEKEELLVKMQECEKSCKEKQNEITLLSATNAAMTVELENAQDEAAHLRVEMASVKRESEQHITSIENLVRARDELITENARLCNEIETLENEITILKGEAEIAKGGLVTALEKFLKWIKGE